MPAARACPARAPCNVQTPLGARAASALFSVPQHGGAPRSVRDAGVQGPGALTSPGLLGLEPPATGHPRPGLTVSRTHVRHHFPGPARPVSCAWQAHTAPVTDSQLSRVTLPGVQVSTSLAGKQGASVTPGGQWRVRQVRQARPPLTPRAALPGSRAVRVCPEARGAARARMCR